MMEAKILLATILRRFHLELVPGQTCAPAVAVTARYAIDRPANIRYFLSFRPRYGMWMRISRR